MAVVYRSGLDWSGDPGDPAKTGASAKLVFAAAHMVESDLPCLEAGLTQARRSRGLPPSYVFKSKNARPEIASAFFAAIAGCPFSVHVLTIDKALWPQAYLTATRGPDRIVTGIVELIGRCSSDVVGGQALLIDGSKDDTPTIQAARHALRRALAQQQRHPFSKVRMCRDDGAGGAILQLADMVAGIVRRDGVSSTLLSGVRRKVREV